MTMFADCRSNYWVLTAHIFHFEMDSLETSLICSKQPIDTNCWPLYCVCATACAKFCAKSFSCLRISDISGSDPGSKTCYHYAVWSFPQPLQECASTYALDSPFRLLSYSIFVCHPIIRRLVALLPSGRRQRKQTFRMTKYNLTVQTTSNIKP
jgi:hypothetical protein